ncbi:DUF438 domain-containing protein [Peptoniphilus ivorii]|uniref:DUF438 domain-containing protein n=1 Tax=Aedoeadaptatus ivorii TaxID=54006 RepID=UPI0027825936|nr:DUF438 domain-containing protein [Peptoniphilus ivorii]MDQ0508645.1 DUF438 domain-containing protein [Peptoniphilus ivorii]
MQQINLNTSIYTLTKEYPELIGVLADLGFGEIKKKALRHTVGKIMTIEKGAKAKGIPMDAVRAALRKSGFEPVAGKGEAAPSRVAQLKSYLARLGAGEDLERVRRDFAAAFEDVAASEIMEAEQAMLAEGTPLEEVQRLCDLHSALFHGATREERIAAAETAVAESVRNQKAPAEGERARHLYAMVGHPLHTLRQENRALEKLLQGAKDALNRNEGVKEYVDAIADVSIHYAKKGDLLYPHLKAAYGVSGPSNVMWTVDGELRKALRHLQGEDSAAELMALFARMEEMIYKEENILFPICVEHFTDADWRGIYRDMKAYPEAFGVSSARWEAGESAPKNAPDTGGRIALSGGSVKPEEISALLNTLPLEITFIDAEDTNRYFNDGPKIFHRPSMALGRSVYSCHPPKIEPVVRKMIADFKSGAKDEVTVRTEKAGRKVEVRYMAVRDGDRYLGTMETVRDLTDDEARPLRKGGTTPA